MRAAFAMAIDLRERLGCATVVVDAKRDADSFYSSFGFEPLEVIGGRLEERPPPTPMFLPILDIEAAIKISTRERL